MEIKISEEIKSLQDQIDDINQKRIHQTSIPPRIIKSRHIEENVDFVSPQINGRTFGLAWNSYIPTFTNLTLGNGTADCAYTHIGKTTIYRGRIVFGNTTSVTGQIRISLPETAKYKSYESKIATISIGGNLYPGALLMISPTELYLYAINTASTYGAFTASSSTVPASWAETDFFSFCTVYESV